MKNEIVRALEQAGALVLKMDRNREGFDLLVVAPAGNTIMRVGADPLTAFEALIKIGIETVGGAYYVVETPEQALSLVRGDPQTIMKLIENGAGL